MPDLTMLDSISVANLPPGADAYLGYVGGRWPTWAQLAARFPSATLLSMAVTASEDAAGCDVETGDLVPAQVPAWVRQQAGRGVWRPVVYAGVATMPAVIAALGAGGLGRVRLLSAHYGAGQHICGPGSCAYPGVPAMDGTQWTDTAPGVSGSLIDQSALIPGFFSPGSSSPSPLEENMMLLGGPDTDTPIPLAPGDKTVWLAAVGETRVNYQFRGHAIIRGVQLGWAEGSKALTIPAGSEFLRVYRPAGPDVPVAVRVSG